MPTLNQVISQVPEIANFKPKKMVLHLAGHNIVIINETAYELRLFTFYLARPNPEISTFADYVRVNNLGETQLKVFPQLKLIPPLSFNVNTDDAFCILSIRELEVGDV